LLFDEIVQLSLDLLRKLANIRTNRVWARDTSYIAMARGFVYLTAVVDVFRCKVLAHKVAITLEACHARRSSNRRPPCTVCPRSSTAAKASSSPRPSHRREAGPPGLQVVDGQAPKPGTTTCSRAAVAERVYLNACDSVSVARADIAQCMD